MARRSGTPARRLPLAHPSGEPAQRVGGLLHLAIDNGHLPPPTCGRPGPARRRSAQWPPAGTPATTHAQRRRGGAAGFIWAPCSRGPRTFRIRGAPGYCAGRGCGPRPRCCDLVAPAVELVLEGCWRDHHPGRASGFEHRHSRADSHQLALDRSLACRGSAPRPGAPYTGSALRWRSRKICARNSSIRVVERDA